jgi:hypothetical protein
MERNREQALLAAALDKAADVQEDAPPATVEDEDASGLLDDVEPARLAAGCGNVRRRVEPGGDANETQSNPALPDRARLPRSRSSGAGRRASTLSARRAQAGQRRDADERRERDENEP